MFGFQIFESDTDQTFGMSNAFGLVSRRAGYWQGACEIERKLIDLLSQNFTEIQFGFQTLDSNKSERIAV